MLKRYRQDYTGELVVLARKLVNGIWVDETEWIESSVEFTPRYSSALVLGSERWVSLSILKNKNFTTYSINLDTTFSLTSDCGVAYAGIEQVQANPGKYHLIPHDPRFSPVATLTYLACFDGHQQVYLLDVDECDGLVDVVRTYSDVNFVRITETGRLTIKTELQYLPNYQQVSRIEWDMDVRV